jgi:hypothetical protein
MNDVSIELKKDEWLMLRVSTYIVNNFQSLQRVQLTKKWWQFWIPKEMYLYSTIEKTTKKKLPVVKTDSANLDACF